MLRVTIHDPVAGQLLEEASKTKKPSDQIVTELLKERYQTEPDKIDPVVSKAVMKQDKKENEAKSTSKSDTESKKSA